MCAPAIAARPSWNSCASRHRGRAYYTESEPLLDLIHPRSRPSLWALVSIYSGLLDRIERSNYDVFTRRVRLSPLEKSWIVVRALVS
ncbi:MAG: squalene/phytoene synthase family protein [Acidobacteriia bacterium]|nr:squalene/phytoene synthase family protein [Terriglobia bacterium]